MLNFKIEMFSFTKTINERRERKGISYAMILQNESKSHVLNVKKTGF